MSPQPTPKDGLLRQAGVARCWWCGDHEDYIHYHDHEWGKPMRDDKRLYEKICLESFQSGLSWLTILRKRENFRAAFAGFDFERVAGFDESDVERLLQDAGIVRHRGKIESAIQNARRYAELVAERGSLAAHVWSFEPPRGFAGVPAAGIASRMKARMSSLEAFRSSARRYIMWPER